jgi:putative nucleotidyltransferase with HDIG domain
MACSNTRCTWRAPAGRSCRFIREVDADLALAGILLHDTGKVIEYEGTLATRRSRRGILQGHVVLGYQLARKHGIKARWTRSDSSDSNTSFSHTKVNPSGAPPSTPPPRRRSSFR